MIQAGKLNKRITIQEFTAGSPSQDENGEPLGSWETFSQVWAAIEPIQGNEFWAQQQVQSEVTHRVRIRFLEDVAAKMRILYGTRVFVIQAVIDPKEKHKEIQLMCSEGVQDG